MRCVSCNSGDGSSFSALSALSIKMNSLSSLPHVSLPDSLPYSNFLQTSIVLSPSVLRHKKKKPVVFLPYVVGDIPATFANPLSEQERLYGLRTSSRSYWSFGTKNDIRCAFNHGSKDADGKRLHVPERFTDAFDDLVAHRNYLPPRVPITIVWNKHLPNFDSTREHQVYEAFAVLPSDLPFTYVP